MATLEARAETNTLRAAPANHALPVWFNPDLFPFSSRFIDIEGNQIHYIDEGSGPVLLFLHANPAWAYQYRNIIAGLTDHFRCIALDYPGFGLSQQAPQYRLTLSGKSRLVERFIQALNLTDITLVAHDASVAIGMGVVVRKPEWFRALALANGFAWSMRQEDPSIHRFIKVMASAPIRALIVNFNFLTRYFSRSVGGGKLNKAEQMMYLDPTRERECRKLQHDWFRSIADSEDFLTDLRARLDDLTKQSLVVVFRRP